MDELREKAGKKAATVAIGGNCILTVLNIAVGLMTGSYALISEGAHTLSDIVTSIIAYAGFKIGQRPADKEHPIGHGRAEAISGLVIVIFLVMVAYEIISGAFEKLLAHHLITAPDGSAVFMAVFGIFINFIISEYIIRIGKKIKSPAIEADGRHQRTDIYSSIGILIGLIVAEMGFPYLDPIIGFFIGILILKTAFEIGKENIDYIMGKAPSDELENRVRRVANKTPNAQGASNIKIDYVGSYGTAILDVKIDGNLSLYESHEIVKNVENNILEKIPEIQYAFVQGQPLKESEDETEKDK